MSAEIIRKKRKTPDDSAEQFGGIFGGILEIGQINS